MRKNDYQIVEMASDELSLYQWDGHAWRYQRVTFAATEAEQMFVAEHGLALVKRLTVGTWPARIYAIRTTKTTEVRELGGADRVVERVRTMPIPKRQQEDW
jgi:hypothetical protein